MSILQYHREFHFVKSLQSSLPPTLVTTHLFSVFCFAFPEFHTVKIIQYVAFPDWRLSLSNMHLRFPMFFHGLIVHFFLVLSNSLFCGEV